MPALCCRSSPCPCASIASCHKVKQSYEVFAAHPCHQPCRKGVCVTAVTLVVVYVLLLDIIVMMLFVMGTLPNIYDD